MLAGNAQLEPQADGPRGRAAAQMGATILGRAGGRYAAPVILGRLAAGIRYEMPVASAQVKSAVLLAGLFARRE